MRRLLALALLFTIAWTAPAAAQDLDPNTGRVTTPK
jgi:hypothetical protein